MLARKRFLLISFVEGAAVMAAEISGARLLAPFFGSSLHVWSTVMAITLGGLAAGYFLGGKLSQKPQPQRTLLLVLTGAACALCSMTFMGPLMYTAGASLPLLPAVVVSVLVLLFPATLCMGATSPLIISLLTSQSADSGLNSGRIYAVSTVGGILSTFLCGFYLLPAIGVKATLIGFAILLAAAGLLLLVKPYPRSLLLLLLTAGGLAAYGFIRAPKQPYLVYEEEGILGKLEIREEPSRENPSATIRKLLINTIVQTEMDVNTGKSVSEYVRLLEGNLPRFASGKTALVLGLGGGVVSNMLADHGYAVTGVEFDQRIIEMSHRFFYLNPSVTTVCDDARHYLNTVGDRWDLVLFDIFKAEEQPSHVITRQSLSTLKRRLHDNAVVLVNTHGYLHGTKGLGTQCLLATLREAGFYTRICASSSDEAYRNLLILASQKPLPGALYQELPAEALAENGIVNDDDRPVMELLNAPANQEWRSNYIRNYILGH